ncbi:MAG TPA: hypothetical protein PKE69_12555 [Pyrinomonadaceae bacterium]|nr:hypothetical protein [Pyrinomonadaceae bacterium]
MKLIKSILLICMILIIGAFGQILQQESKEFSSPNFEKTYKILESKPNWLFSEIDFCPFDVFPKTVESKRYLPDACDKNANVCLNNCKNNDGMACYTLAILIQSKKSPNQDYSEALFLRACKLGVISGCTNRAARILNDKPDDDKSVKCAVDTFEKTCDEDDAWGCTMFGFSLYLGKGRPQDFEKALKVLPKGCKFGEEDPACQMANQIIDEIKKIKNKTTD